MNDENNNQAGARTGGDDAAKVAGAPAGDQGAGKKEDKTLDVTNQKDLKKKVNDVKVVGTDQFQLLSKASSKSQGWMKSTKAMEIPYAGCVVQVTTQQGDNVAEAVTFVPGVKIVGDENGGRKLVPNRT